MKVKKRGIFLLTTVFFLSCYSAPALAEIPQSYLDEICGKWYWPREGYMFTIEPADDPDFVQMSVFDINSDHDHTDDWDTAEYERIYYLALDTENAKWLCEDGRLNIDYYGGDSLWVTPQDDAEKNFYNGHSSLFAIKKVDMDKENAGYTTGKEDFEGAWVSQSSGDLYAFQALASSEDAYGAVDYVVSIYSNTSADVHIIMTRNGDKLAHKATPFEAEYYLLKSFHTIEHYDNNGKLIDTLEKNQSQTDEATEAATEDTSAESEIAMPRSQAYQDIQSHADTIKLMEGTYASEDMKVTIAVDERYAQDNSYDDFYVYVTYLDPQTRQTVGSDQFLMDNQGTNWGYLYGLVEDQEGTGYNIIKTDSNTIQFRLNEDVICELKQ